jgi:alkylated DNA repair dioxygenase AlkB
MDARAHPRGAHRRARLLPLSIPAPPPGARVLALPDATIWYEPAWLGAAEADALFATLGATLAWQVHAVRVWGRLREAPRRSAWYGDSGVRYAYSGLDLAPLPWPAPLAALRARLVAGLGVPFNATLANLYRDGRNRMGWHADDERALGDAPVIASVSLGAARPLLLRHRRRALPVESVTLGHGSLLVMAGVTQRHWQHALPARVRVDAPRINLTFRHVLERAPAAPAAGRRVRLARHRAAQPRALRARAPAGAA